MLINLKALLENTKGKELNYVVCSVEKELCEPCVGVDELKQVLQIQQITVDEVEKGEVVILAFERYQIAEDLYDWFQGYVDACEALRDFEDHVCDIEFEAIENKRELSESTKNWIIEERFDLVDKMRRMKLEVEITLQNLMSRA